MTQIKLFAHYRYGHRLLMMLSLSVFSFSSFADTELFGCPLERQSITNDEKKMLTVIAPHPAESPAGDCQTKSKILKTKIFNDKGTNAILCVYGIPREDKPYTICTIQSYRPKQGVTIKTSTEDNWVESTADKHVRNCDASNDDCAIILTAGNI